MGQEMKLEHLGYAVEWREYDDRWRCEELELDAPSFTGLKKKMQERLATNKPVKVNIPAMISRGGFSGDSRRVGNLEPCTIVSLIDQHTCWVMIKGDRRKEGYHKLFPITEELKVLLARYKELYGRLNGIQAQMDSISMAAGTMPFDRAQLESMHADAAGDGEE